MEDVINNEEGFLKNLISKQIISEIKNNGLHATKNFI